MTMQRNPFCLLCATAALMALSASGQTKFADMTTTLTFPAPTGPEDAPRTHIGTGSVLPIGSAAIEMQVTQTGGAASGGVTPGHGSGRATLTVATSRLDSFNLAFDFPDPGAQFSYNGQVKIAGGTGIYQLCGAPHNW